MYDHKNYCVGTFGPRRAVTLHHSKYREMVRKEANKQTNIYVGRPLTLHSLCFLLTDYACFPQLTMITVHKFTIEDDIGMSKHVL